MKALPLKHEPGKYTPCEPEEADHVELNMPGPIPYRVIPVQIKGKREGTGNWTWNGNVENPTLKPSILTRHGEFVCHSWVIDGKVQFLGDCTHKHAGQTLDLLEIEDGRELYYAQDTQTTR